MALKGAWDIKEDDILYTCESATERGVILMRVTAGSGVVRGDVRGQADLEADPSGLKPAGMLLNDVVSTDETQYHTNFHKNETKVGAPCHLGTRCRVTTDKVTGSPTDGDTAYVTANGVVTPTVSATGGEVATPPVGKFRGKKDENGYVTVDIDVLK